MGLTETIGGDLVPTTDSNNLDVHMEKNTEYGAMAILSASSYGNPNIIADGETTTGNKTGIVINTNNEWVAAATDKSINTGFISSNDKYKNVYTSSYIAKIGDAIGETNGWHGGSSSGWFNDYYGYSLSSALILRSTTSRNIFSYDTTGPDDRYAAYYTKAWHSRAAMVCGEGI